MAGVIFTIADIFFISLLLVTYFNQKKVSKIRSVLYRYMLWTLIVLLLSEVAATYIISYGYNSLLIDILVRLHWSTGIIIFSFLYFYTHTFLDNLEADNFFELLKGSNRFISMSIVFLISLIIYFFIPFSDIYTKNISYIPGPAAAYILSFCAAVVSLLVIHTIKHRKRIPTIKKISVAIMIIELWIVFFFQLKYTHIALVASSMSLQMFFLYFMVENPDLELISQLESTKQELEKSSHAKSDFLSNMSHEIRTPMNAIIGFSESILNQKEFNKTVTMQDIGNISVASKNLLDIINNILDISKIESGKETLIEKEYSLNKMILDLKDIITQRLKNNSIKLILDIDNQLPDKLYGDYTKLYQIVLNLLTNAVKYTEVGKIVLKISGDLSIKDVRLKISVKDTGFGIKEEDRDKIFGKFNRLENATIKEIEGTGLGLVITKQYVELMGGTINFTSTYGVGTTFNVEVIQKIIDRTPLGDLNKIEEDNKEDIDFIDCSNYKILIVDDNLINIKVAEKLLSRYKFQIDHCLSGKECIYKIKSDIKYDLIFMDHMMPEMDGIETLHTIKKLDLFDIPPVVALTANAITGMKEMYLSEGFDDYISKPINIKELNELVLKYFKR